MQPSDPSDLRAEDERFRLLVESVRDYAIYMLDPSGRVITWNLGAERNKGYTGSEIIGQNFSRFFLPEDVAAGVPERILAQAEAEEHSETEGWRVRKDGSRFWAKVVVTAIRDNSGTLKGFGKVTRDLTERKQHDDELRASADALHAEKDLLQVTLKSIGDGVISTDHQGLVVLMNPSAETMTGWTMAQSQGRPLEEVFQLIDAENLESQENPVRECLADNRVTHLREGTALLGRQGLQREIQDSAAPIRNSDGAVIGAILVFQDVTKMRHAQRELRFQAEHDPLTGVPNRKQLESRLLEAIEDSAKNDRGHTLCFLDLDRFKVINDTAGHVAGDAFLRLVSQVLRHSLRNSDFVARLGGDEFAVILYNCANQPAVQILSKLVEAVAAIQFSWEGRLYQTTVSVGATTITPTTGLSTHVMKQADVACYSSKRAGRNRISIYQPDQGEVDERQRELHMVSEIREALVQKRFRLVAQEIVPTWDSDDIHYELLVRMIDHTGESVLPGRFIPAAELYGLMVDIDRWVLQEALGRLAKDLCQVSNLSISINLSAQSLNDPTFLPFLLKLFEESELSPSKVILEVTETALVHNIISASHMLQELRAIGCRIALDDFGAGLSSFGYLRNFKVDIIKIEGSFVRDMLLSPVDLAIVKSINQIAHELNAKTVAEYVESKEIFERLKELKVDFGQGYALGRPKPIEELLARSLAIDTISPVIPASNPMTAAAQPENDRIF